MNNKIILFYGIYLDFFFSIGTPALTTRGLVESDIVKVVDFIDRGLKLAKEISVASGPKLIDFKDALHNKYGDKVKALRGEVESFSEKFPLPGYDEY